MNEALIIPIGAFYASLLAWWVIAWLERDQVINTSTFYKPGTGQQRSLLYRVLSKIFRSDVDRVKNVAVAVSLFASNIAVTGFLAPVFLSATSYGLWLAILPIGFFVAYSVFINLTGKLAPFIEKLEGSNDESTLNRIGETIKKLRGKASLYTPVVSVCLALFNIIFLSYEIFFASDLIATLLLPKAHLAFFLVSIPIFICSLLCVMASGMPGVLRTDIAQTLGIAILVGVIFYNFFTATSLPERTFAGAIPDLSNLAMATLVLYVVNVLLGPYINLNTWLLSDIAQDTGARTGDCKTTHHPMWLGATAFAIVGVGLIVVATLARTSAADPWILLRVADTWLLAVIGIGLSAVVISTIDSLMISGVYHIKSLIERAVNAMGASDEVFELSLPINRIVVAAIYVVPYLLMMVFYIVQPNPLLTVVSIASLLVIFSPLTILCIALARVEGGLAYVSNRVILSYLALFSCAAIVAIVVHSVPGALVGNFVLMGIGIFIAFGIYVRARKPERKLAKSK